MSVIAAICSAVAATLSAIAAIVMWRTEVNIFRHTARPELVLSGWTRGPIGERSTEKIAFKHINNVGNGSAIHPYVNAFSIADDNRPLVSMSTIRGDVIPPGGCLDVTDEMLIYWNNVAGEPGSKSLTINIDMLCWDTTGVRYRVKYSVHVGQLSGKIHMANEIAPCVMLGLRAVEVQSVRYLRIKTKLSKWPLIGRHINLN